VSSGQTDLRALNAVRAWLVLYSGLKPPDRISVLKPAHRKSAVYRLEGMGRQSPVRRCTTTALGKSRTVT
jgi:hypothetical protein